jgi:hypothetical protein
MISLLALLAACGPQEAPRVNHEGRILPPTPPVTRPLPCGTPEADAILSTLQVFPKDNPWNEDISERPVHPDSDKIVDAVGRILRFRWNHDMLYMLVPPNQPRVDVPVDYGNESDPGPFPIPDDAPVEGGPVAGPRLAKFQREGNDGDRHVILIDPAAMKLYELFHVFKGAAGWTAGCAAVFDLRSNRLRPDGWTSGDAAGLPIFPAVVRYDEVARGSIEHALRVTVRKTRKAYVYPATHHASTSPEPFLPRMGERLRLKKDLDISRFPPHIQAILKALKKYGMIVADNGIAWAISITPDPRIQGLETLDHKAVKGGDFEVIVTTGPDEGPRSR